jgi:DNA polymerase V
MPSQAVPLPYPTNDSLKVNRWADYLCERMFKEGYQYKKPGIMLSEISPVTRRQADLLEPETTSNASLMQALDNLHQRYGRGTVKVSTQGAFKRWQMLQEQKSPNYTTAWDEVPVV